jgi:hypothetical protein
MKNALLFGINTETKNGFEVNVIEPEKINPVADNIQCLATFELNSITYLVGFENNTLLADIYLAFNEADGTYLNLKTQNSVTFNASMAEMMYAGEVPVCLAYDPSSGNINFLQIAPDLSFSSVHSLLYVGTGITTIKAFTYRGDQFLIAYNMNTGSVTKYQIVASNLTSISATIVWSAKWAVTWTRFSFFQMGAENFFIKTNLKAVKVNIDHFMDDPNEGSHPVLNMDAPPQMIGLNNVNAFVDPKGFPYFATYRTTGEMTFNRIHGSCLGWDIECQIITDTNQNLMLPFLINKNNYLILY